MEVMSRLILVPQYPTKMRYQEWWYEQFPYYLKRYFDTVIVLGQYTLDSIQKSPNNLFAPVDKAIEFEQSQISEFMLMDLFHNDVLLLNDLSFPGLFAHVLFHKKPSKCFAICHATSKNSYDYFASVRKSKYPVEKGMAKLFDKVIVGSKYHAKKLGWDNIQVLPLPESPHTNTWVSVPNRKYDIVSVSRHTKQKRNKKVERMVGRMFSTDVLTITGQTWWEYYQNLSQAKILLITSSEETFGYQVMDAKNCGVIPFAPNKFSYPELLSKEYLYNNVQELFEMIYLVLRGGNFCPLGNLKNTNQSRNFYTDLAIVLEGLENELL